MAGIPGLGDRGSMEKERLARLAARNASSGQKRERSVSPPAATRPSKVTRLSGIVDVAQEQATGATIESSVGPQIIDLDSPSPPPSSRTRIPISSQAVAAPTAPIPSVSTAAPSSTMSQILKYPQGVIKKTWAFGQARSNDDIKIEEVLEKHTLRTAVLSAFQWDTEWVFSKVNRSQTKLVFVMQAKEQSMRDQILRETEDLRATLRLCFPPMDGQISCMHSKLMLLFHPHKLRIAIPSANLMKYDWGETGIMENSVFIIDLPRATDGQQEDQTSSTAFREELLYFLEKQGLESDIRRGVLNFNFSATSRLAFVHSSGGVSYGDDMRRTGYMSLNKAVRGLGLTTQSGLQIDFTASSIGSLNDSQLEALYTAARGAAPLKPAPKSSKKASRSDDSQSVREFFRIYFPTLDTVASSKGGVDNGGTICFQRRWWEGVNAFPRDCFRDYQSVRKGFLSHNKIIYARGHDETTKKDVAWVYMGSANMSESAWGKLVWDAKRKEWKMNCKNWECGVLLPVPGEKLTVHETGLASAGNKDPVSLQVFDGVVSVPFTYPGRLYQGREPWYFTEPHDNVRK